MTCLQVLRNLISNALKFTPENGTVQTSVSFINDSRANRITKEFTLGNKQKYTGTCHGYIQLCVTDSGVGLSPEQVSKMFGQGVQFNQNLLQGGNGSGLGLYIAKGIVEQHEGSLEVSSEGLGKGTTFTLIIPVYKFEGYVAYAPRHSSISSDFSRHLSMDRPLRLLIVDDAASNRKMLKRILNMRKHVCDEAQDGNEAVLKYMTSEFHKQPYDAVLMDNEMPEMDGPTAAKEMRDLGCQYLIVGITGNVLPEDVEAFIAAGADQVLPKPLQMSDLENTFKNYLKKRRVPLTEEQQNRRLKYLQRHIPSDDESSYREISMREQGQDAAEVGKVEVDEKEKNANFLSTISTHDSERFYKVSSHATIRECNNPI
jgi:two-component system sensor histidine kinase BarA